jgi:hypothetical protein
MGHPLDPEFPNLLPTKGIVDYDLPAFEAAFVASFPASTRRPAIFARFLVLLETLRSIGLSCEAWLDGSFLTEKTDPDDIDIALLTDNAILGRLSLPALDTFNYLIDNHADTKARYLCDLYSINRDDFNDRVYWRGLFGFTRIDEPKGFVRLQI